jgi:2-polyprenyl-3-methyl-5-hydroxy-6-metoxy-1,4-benzoquinol methylase
MLQALKKHIYRFPKLKHLLMRLHPKYYAVQMARQLEEKLIYSYVAQLDARLRELEKTQSGNNQTLALISNSVSPEPTLAQPISQAATQSQFAEESFLRICRELRYDPIHHRKLWEYVYIVRALELSGKLQPGMKGLGFGVGKDPMVALMVQKGCEIIATDMNQETAIEKGWATTNQYSTRLNDLNERLVCSDELLQQKVTLRVVDMNAIPEDLQQSQFDFVWSACAFEHLGSLEAGLNFVRETLKCLKPGGVAIHTTEYNASSNHGTIEGGHTVLYRQRDIEALAQQLRNAGGALDLNFNLGSQPLDRFYDVPPYSDWNHLKLRLDQHIATSFGLFVTKL